MRSAFSVQEIDFYRANGFLAIPDLLDADELKIWRAVFDHAVQRETTFSYAHAGADEPADAYYANVFVELL